MKIPQTLLNALNNMPKHPSMLTRVFLMAVSVLILLGLSYIITGTLIPDNNMQGLIFQGSALLIVFGSLILEDKFTKPADAVINSVAVIISLIPVHTSSQDSLWNIIFFYSLFVGLCGIVNLTLITNKVVSDTRSRITKMTYQLSVVFGKAEIIFSMVFLYAVFSFYGLQSEQTALLIIFWGFYICLMPLKLPHFFQALFEAIFSKDRISNEEGEIVRVDFPDLIKVRLYENSKWNSDLVAVLGDGIKRKVLPLYTQIQDSTVIGTGLLLDKLDSINFNTIKGGVYRLNTDVLDTRDFPIGIITIDSQIAKLYFETWKPQIFNEGMLVYCEVNNKRVYYQVSDAITNEESFEKHRHGFQIVEAHQLGTHHNDGGFKKFSWLPEMNTPVYLAGKNIQGAPLKLATSQMSLGVIPETDIEVICDIDDMISHHTAILGVTGSGKTELTLKIIERAIGNGIKVFCIDITGQYITRLSHLATQQMYLEIDDVKSISNNLDNKNYVISDDHVIRVKFKESITNFIKSDKMISIFTIPTITNTKATIVITELYLSCIFEYNREQKDERNRILVVLEEAHTIIPEGVTMGLQDFDSKAVVARLSQIALQGRKFKVGLLIIAQRTATVSKTVLTQCNTMITFSSFDQTGVEFLSNIYGREHTSKISNLPFLQALVFGKGVKSERPVVIEMHRNKEKDDTLEDIF